MRKSHALMLLAALLVSTPALAGPDDFVCDTAIYGGETAHVRPNLLLILDTSASMQELVPATLCGEAATAAYQPSVDYTAGVKDNHCGERSKGGGFNLTCSRDAVYECVSYTDGVCSHWRDPGLAVDEIPCSDIRNALLADTGSWVGRRRLAKLSASAATFGCEATSRAHVYATGNWIVWQKKGGSDCTTREETKLSMARKVVGDLIQNLQGVDIGLMVFNFTDAAGRGGVDGGRFAEKVVAGRNYIADIKEMNGLHAGTTTNRQALMAVVDSLAAPGGVGTPLAETLLETMRYFQGETTAFNAHTYTTGYAGPYTSPIAARCQLNNVVIISDGISADDVSPLLQSICTDHPERGDCDDDGRDIDSDGLIRRYNGDGSHLLDDVAAYLYRNDLSADFPGIQNLRTFSIGFGLAGADADAVQLLQATAVNGGGEAYLATDHQGLAAALTSILGTVLDEDASFVAPVVPVSPDNRTYSGQRIYLGLFKPITGKDWQGNLKKFGLDTAGVVVDQKGRPALDEAGRLLESAVSYWAGDADSGQVARGGVGEGMVARGASSRQIYTYLGGGNTRLSADTHAFDPANTAPLAKRMGVAAGEAEKIIGYVRGFDVYDEDRDGETMENRGWILGDILHSRPLVLPYAGFTIDQENDPAANRTLIFVGSNDGQLHAFADVDGEELWSFIPPAVLPNLRYLGNGTHHYFMDSSPTAYVYDRNRDGRIDPGDDRVILLVGMRRGGGIDTLSSGVSRGAYYALDVTEPADPRFLWELDNTTAGFAELGETWAEPVFGTVRLGSSDRIVALIGAGYDNNEDLRFGDTQTFPETTTPLTDTTLRGDQARPGASSSGSSLQVNAKGRGIYLLELARVDSDGVPDIHATPTRLWHYVHDEERHDSDPANNPTYSFPTSLAAIDSNFDGYLDRVYAGDTGGNLWRFTIGDQSSAGNWSGRKIFSANPSGGEEPVTSGRRILYPPSVVLEPGYIGLFFGTGDRAHPLNTSVTDRLYAVYDRDAYGLHPGQPAPLTEAALVDVTDNSLQAADPPRVEACTDTALDPKCLLQRLFDPRRYGWFIRLNDPVQGGEKVLAPALVFNRVAYFTTFTPRMAADDPCLPGNLGTAKLYAVHYQTGEAVFNFNLLNDEDENSNERARPVVQPGVVLDHSDRTQNLGEGIPSGVVIVIRSDGTATALVGGRNLGQAPTRKGGTTIQTYWMMR